MANQRRWFEMLIPDEERAHFSYNQLITMLSCPYKYYLQYIVQQEWDYVPSSVSFGSAMHDAISGFHKALQNGGVKDRESFVDSFTSKFTQEANNVVFRNDDEFDDLLSKGQALIAEYTDSFQHIKPMEVEMEFRLPLVNTYTGELLEKDLVGKIDLIADSNVYELKTASSAMPPSAVDENLQLTLYAWAFRMIFGKAPSKLVLVNLIKTKQPKIQVLDTTIDAQKEQKLMHLIFKVNEAIQKEVFYPNPRGMFGCSSCSYALSCEYAF